MKLIVVGTEAELKKLRDEHDKAELERRRIALRALSLEDAKKRLEEVNLACETQLHILEEAYLSHYDDPDEPWEEAHSHNRKLEKMEREYGRLIRLWENLQKRIAREADEIRKAVAKLGGDTEGKKK